MYRNLPTFLQASLILGTIGFLFIPFSEFTFAQVNQKTQARLNQPKSLSTKRSRPPRLGQRPKLNQNQLDFSGEGRPRPGTRNNGAGRSDNQCDQETIALIPAPLDRPDQVFIAKTTSDRPTLWIYNPYRDGEVQNADLIFRNEENEEITRFPLTLPTKSGIVGIELPAQTPPLQENQVYNWELWLTCAHNPRAVIYPLVGSLQKVTSKLLPGDTDDYVNASANGIWHNALDVLARLRLQDPQDINLKDNWRILLTAKGIELAELVDYEIVGIIHPNPL